MNIKFFPSSKGFREWLEENHEKAPEVWVGFYKKSSGKTGMTYAQAVDEALCFGWIDSIVKRIDEVSYTNRFTPRKPKSTWSPTNIQRINELVRLGRVKPAGLKVFQERDQEKSRRHASERKIRQLDPTYQKN